MTILTLRVMPACLPATFMFLAVACLPLCCCLLDALCCWLHIDGLHTQDSTSLPRATLPKL
jgi:hypothetical protein